MGVEIFLDVINNGRISIALSVYEDHGFSVIFTAMDDEGRRILRAPIMDHGHIKVYETAEEAIRDAVSKLTPRTLAQT